MLFAVYKELHAILECDTFKLKRQCFLSRISALSPNLTKLTAEKQLITILCPATSEIAKCVTKYLEILSNIRNEIDNCLNPKDLDLYIKHRA